MRAFGPLVALGCIGWLRAMAAGPAQAQSGLYLFVPLSTSVSTFTTNPDGTLTSMGSISGGGSTGGFMSVIRGDQAFAYQTYAGFGLDSIQVINTATRSVVQTLAATQGPEGMVFSPNGTTLYVANNASGVNIVSVFSVNATTGMLTQTGTINVGAGTQPRVLAVSPDGSTLYSANQTGNTVSVVNLGTNTVTATIPVGTQPLSIAINPAGTRLYVGNFTSSTVSVINTATNTVAATINVGGGTGSLAVSPNGQYLYVAARSQNQVNIYDAASNTLVGTAASTTGPNGIVISPDGSTLYVTNSSSGNGQAFSIDASTGLLTSIGFFTTGGVPFLAGMCGAQRAPA